MQATTPDLQSHSAGGRPRGLLGWLKAEAGPRESLALGLLMVIVSVWPVLVAAYPQMVDYPAHLARFHVMLTYDQSPFLQEYYGFKWRWMGNLGADLLIQPLARFYPIEQAGRIVVALIPLLTGLGVLAVEWALRRRITAASMLAMVMIWSPALLLGFLNFGLSLAAALFVFAAWVLLEGKSWRALVMVPLGFLVWVCHVSGWGTLGLMVFGYEWSRDKSWRSFVAPLPLALPILALLFGAGTKGLASYGYGEAVSVYKWAIWRQALRGTTMGLDYASTLFLLALIAGSLLFRRLDPRLGWATFMMLACSLVLPRHIFGGDLVDARMISTGLMAGCLALDWKNPRWLLLASPLLFLVRLDIIADNWKRTSVETEQALKMIEPLPQGVRLATLAVTERSDWAFNPQEHIAGYALVRKDALVNANFALPMVHMLTIKEGGKYFRDPYHRLNHRRNKPIDLTNYNPARYADWFWYIGVAQPEKLPKGAKLVATGHNTFLAQLPKRKREKNPE